ncbi:caspase family protein [Burkholderia ubonensis]|uniref:caspase family protein n=1 Tax=Burkholderia ubonensis TaxID=101571 RepID=UPI0007C715E7|nr:caspase family protein [Burkholderia ubonensis]
MSLDLNAAEVRGRRVLLCIGCDKYENLGQLTGAENDAQDAYGIFTNPSFGDYPQEDARLLLSPDVATVNRTLIDLFRSRTAVDTFTLFFAGHGGVIRGTYYLALREADLAMMSTSALSLSAVFQTINDVAPAQCNIILDACQAGGLVSDLGALLKPELIGDANTSGVSIFASSAANQTADETDGSGVGTRALLDVIAGEKVVNTRSPFLDLIDAGRVASFEVASAGGQIPVVWGANLYGQSRFSRNPHYDGNQASAIHDMTRIVPISTAGRTISGAAQQIWRLYHAEPETITPKALQAMLQPVVDKLHADPQSATQFVQGVCTAIIAKLRGTSNSFAVVETIGTCISTLLAFAGDEGAVDAAICELVSELTLELTIALQDVLAHLEAKSDYLLVNSISDLFYLPLRLTRLLGWAGALLYFYEQLLQPHESASTLVSRLATLLLENYPLSMTGMSDSETPYILVFANAALSHDMTEQAEMLIGMLFNSILSARGALASPSINPEDVLSYLHARITGNFGDCHGAIAQPCESLSLVLLLAARYGLAEECDGHLQTLDHLTHCIFLPDSHLEFAKPIIRNGRNHVFQIGHKVWQAADLVQRWREACVPQLEADVSIRHASVRIAATCAALVFPDRSPWFIAKDYFSALNAPG